MATDTALRLKKTKADNPRRQINEAKRRSRAGMLFISPFIVGFFCFYFSPLVMSFYYSITDVKMTKNGLAVKQLSSLFENYSKILKDAEFLSRLTGTLTGMLQQLPVIIIFSLFIV